MRLLIVDYMFICTKPYKGPERIVYKTSLILYSGVKFAIGKCAGSALAETTVRVRIQNTFVG